MSFIKKFFSYRASGLFLIVLLFSIVLAISHPGFTSRINIFGMLYSISVNCIVVGAMTLLFVSGGFDMAVGSVLGLSGIIVALLMKIGLPIPIAIMLTLLVGVAIGALMGYIISYIGINPFVVTLAGWFVFGALVFIVGGGASISGIPNAFTLIATYKVLNVPMIIIFSIITIIVFEILLQKNRFIRQNFFIGGNEKAAELVGIKVKKVKLINYIFTSLMAAVAGIFLTARFSAAYNVAGSENAFQIITAVIIGGASLKGGRGSVIGSFLGLVFVALIYDALVLYNVNILWNKIFIGAILILAVIIDINLQKRNTLAC